LVLVNDEISCTCSRGCGEEDLYCVKEEGDCDPEEIPSPSKDECSLLTSCWWQHHCQIQ